MTKAEIVAQISRQSGIEKTVVMTVIESFMALLSGEKFSDNVLIIKHQ